MRIQAPCTRPWQVYHCTQARMLTHVVWVDDVLRQWCEFDWPLRPLGDSAAKTVHQASAIRIMVDRGLVLIDPIVDDGEARDRMEVDTLQAIARLHATETEAERIKELVRRFVRGVDV